jgi:hypothetical protein
LPDELPLLLEGELLTFEPDDLPEDVFEFPLLLLEVALEFLSDDLLEPLEELSFVL